MQGEVIAFDVAAFGLIILLPVVAILMITGEWSQRTVFSTFTQESRRIRVVNAKLAASLLLGGGAAVFGGVVTAAGLGLVAASGLAAITYANREPVADLDALLDHLAATGSALGVDAARCALWATSGHAPLALSRLPRAACGVRSRRC